MSTRKFTRASGAAAARSKPARAKRAKKSSLGLTVRGTPRLIAPGGGRIDKDYERGTVGMASEGWRRLDAARGKMPRGEFIQWTMFRIPPAAGQVPEAQAQ